MKDVTSPASGPAAGSGAIGLPPGLQLFLRLILLLSLLPLLFLLELYESGRSLLQSRLWSEASDRFGDFWHYRYLLQFIHTRAFFLSRDRFAYPAPCAILYQWLYSLGSHPHLTYNLLLWATEIASGLLFLRAILRRGLRPLAAAGLVLVMLLTSYPWLFLYDRGNIEVFIYLLVAAGTWAWFLRYEKVSAALWGCAGAFKIYPLLLLALYLRRTSWRSFATGALVFLGVLLFSFWYVGPTIRIAANGTMWGIRGFVGTYGAHTRFNELVLDHSLLGGLKEIISLPFLHPAYEQITLSHIYEGVVILLGPAAFLRWRKSSPPINQLCLLLLLLMLLPPVSYDYTLIYAYLIMGVVTCAYLFAIQRKKSFAGAKIYFAAFAILFTAENWINIHSFEPNGLFKAIALITIGVLLIRFPLRLESRSEETELPTSVTAGPARDSF